MRRVLVSSSLLAVVLAVSSHEALAQKKGAIVPAGNKEFTLLAKFTEIPATFQAADAKKNKIKVRIENTAPTKDPAKLEEKSRHEQELKKHHAELERLQREYLQMQQQKGRPSPKDKQAQQQQQQRQKRLSALTKEIQETVADYKKAAEKANPRHYLETSYVEFELQVKENAPIRKMNVPSSLSAEEKLKLKGKEKLPGYAATLEELSPGTHLKIHLELPKKAAESTSSSESEVTGRPVVKMIVAGEATPTKKK